jgi:serine/threonine-protein kinase
MARQGQIIDGKYEVLAFIGEGGMSCVYLARDQRLNKQWAVKEIKQTGDRERDELIARSFIVEANLMKRLDHPMLPRIVDIVKDSGTAYVIMDYIEGQSLDTIVRSFGPQAQGDVLEWALDLCSVLDYLHNSSPPIIYRDMKPANIMLKPDGSTCIIDFGIAREYRDASQASLAARMSDTTVLGTRGYAAPEQFGGSGQTDPRTDIYCLGATLYHLLTGHSPADPPYEIFPIRHFDPSLSPGLERIIAKCTQPDPNARFQNCAELYYALENFDKLDLAYRKRQKSKLRSFIAATSLSLLLLLGGGASLLAREVFIGDSYQGLLLSARASLQQEDKIRYFYDAIDTRPEISDAYFELIECFKLNGSSNNEEQVRFNNTLSKNLNKLKSDPRYAELMYEAGILYWHYYAYGKGFVSGDVALARNSGSYDTQRVKEGMEKARLWFAEAAKDQQFAGKGKADIYIGIADFMAITTQGRLEGTFGVTESAEYFNNLSQLNQFAEQENNDVIMSSVGTMTLDAIAMYALDFKNASVQRDELQQLCQQAGHLLEKSGSLGTAKVQEASAAIADAYDKTTSRPVS